MKKLKVKLLSLKYEIELRQNNTEHLKDYIATKVILAILKGQSFYDVEDIDGLQEITLAKLDNIFIRNKEDIKHWNLEVPTIVELDRIISKGNKELRTCNVVSVGDNEKYASAIWLKLMVLSGLIKENEIIDANQYKLKDFVTDSKLRKMLILEEGAFTDFDFIKQKNNKDESDNQKTR